MSYVYFIRPVGQAGPIKIGFSRHPEDRLNFYVPWSPVPLEIAAAVPGNHELERSLHRRFVDAWSHHEWFRATPEMVAMIDALRAGAPIEEAVDLSKLPPRPKRRRIFPEGRLRYLSYRHKLRWATDHARDAADEPRALPADANRIIERWAGNSYRRPFVKPIEPNADELARLDQVIAKPRVHCVAPKFVTDGSYAEMLRLRAAQVAA